jgi:hypothetical protein
MGLWRVNQKLLSWHKSKLITLGCQCQSKKYSKWVGIVVSSIDSEQKIGSRLTRRRSASTLDIFVIVDSVNYQAVSASEYWLQEL